MSSVEQSALETSSVALDQFTVRSDISFLFFK